MDSTLWFRWDGEDLILQLQIQPRASRDEFGAVIGEYLKVRVAAPPIEGRANERLIAFIAKAFGTPKRQVTLLHGEASKHKVLRVHTPTKLPAIPADEVMLVRRRQNKPA
ncbi:MAG: DUF167 family protein [Acidiferrobacterales bacterium]